MSYQEEIRELREKVNSYEELLETVLQGPFKEAIIISGPVNNLYRVQTAGAGDGFFPFDASNEDLHKLKTGTKVIINEKIIVDKLADDLMIKPDPVEFNPVLWESIGGLKSQIEKIRETIELPVKNSKLYKKYGLAPSKGIVLYGPPGCGKTMVAKAIASEFLKNLKLNKDSFIYLKGGELLSMYVGETENRIKNIFERARLNYKKNKQRSVIFIDEAEAILPARGSRKSSDVDKTIVPTFLSEMDGFEENATFIILATNFLYELDDAVIRPGRIDLSVEINRPQLEDDVYDIFKIYLSKTRVHEDVETLSRDAAKLLLNSGHKNQLSGALIKNIVDKAIMFAIKREMKNDPIEGVTLIDIQNSL